LFSSCGTSLLHFCPRSKCGQNAVVDFLPRSEVCLVQACRVELQLGANKLVLETGKLAKQAHGAVVACYGDTCTLTTAVEGGEDSERDFFPLTVDYREKTYAAGKFPGGFIKREGRPTA